MGEKRQIYVVLSQTGTILSRFLKLVTRAEYNHSSISLEEDLSIMYSFGRRNPYNPFWGGFVTESPHFGTFKRFHKTKVLVLAVEIDDQKYAAMKQHIEDMKNNWEYYKYNIFGLLLAGFHIYLRRERYYYCSEFVKYILASHGVEGACDLCNIVQPRHFAQLPNVKAVYCGSLKDFATEQKSIA